MNSKYIVIHSTPENVNLTLLIFSYVTCASRMLIMYFSMEEIHKSMEEIHKTVLSMETDKVPRSDGFLIFFYQIY
jgi:hypothetical protein